MKGKTVGSGAIMLRVLRHGIASAGAALVAALLSLSAANAQSASDSTPPRNWDEVFAQVVGDQTALFGEGGNNAVLAGLRIYFGQHDKTLIDRHRQDDFYN